ncbi:MAG: hypothetical protein AAF568_10110, partial [Pseudomonadota bacterium]
MGNIAAGAASRGFEVASFDLIDRGYAGVTGGVDFLGSDQANRYPVENIIFNPPYGRREGGTLFNRKRLEEIFVLVGLERARRKVAAFLPAPWPNSKERGAWLETLPLARIYSIGPRPSCPPGTAIERGESTGQGTQDFCWFVFEHGHDGAPTYHWLRRDE